MESRIRLGPTKHRGGVAQGSQAPRQDVAVHRNPAPARYASGASCQIDLSERGCVSPGKGGGGAIGWTPFYIGFGTTGIVAIALSLLELVSGQKLWGLALIGRGRARVAMDGKTPAQKRRLIACFGRHFLSPARLCGPPSPQPRNRSRVLVSTPPGRGRRGQLRVRRVLDELGTRDRGAPFGLAPSGFKPSARTIRECVVITPQPCEPGVKQHAKQQGLRLLDQQRPLALGKWLLTAPAKQGLPPPPFGPCCTA